MGHEFGLSWQETCTPPRIIQHLCACGVKFSLRLSTCVSKASNAHTYDFTTRPFEHQITKEFPTSNSPKPNERSTSQHHVLPEYMCSATSRAELHMRRRLKRKKGRPGRHSQAQGSTSTQSQSKAHSRSLLTFIPCLLSLALSQASSVLSPRTYHLHIQRLPNPQHPSSSPFLQGSPQPTPCSVLTYRPRISTRDVTTRRWITSRHKCPAPLAQPCTAHRHRNLPKFCSILCSAGSRL